MTTRTSFHQLASLILGACIMSSITSCSDSHVKTGGGRSSEAIEAVTTAGKYEVVFSPLNTSVSGIFVGKAFIYVIADQISIGLSVTDSPALTLHSQFIYTASECPTDADDINDDGFIDPLEASKVLGHILIPLDGNLNSQAEGITIFPRSNSMGSYNYYQEGALSRLLTDLQLPDMQPKDELVKLIPGETFKLEGKVMVVQGVPDDFYLPGSLRTIGASDERTTLPIACGKIIRGQFQDTDTEVSGDNG